MNTDILIVSIARYLNCKQNVTDKNLNICLHLQLKILKQQKLQTQINAHNNSWNQIPLISIDSLTQTYSDHIHKYIQSD